MDRIARHILAQRHGILGCIIVLTLFFGYYASKLSVKTIYSDLLPQGHPYITVHNDIRNVFGGSNQVLVMVQVKDPKKGGAYKDVFNPDTLGKVKFINDELRKFHAVDRYKILSIAENKIRNMQLTSRGYISEPVMWPRVPQTEEALHKLRLNVYGNPACYPSLISLDSKSALIMVDFFEEQIDYRTCFREFQDLRKRTEDQNHIIAIAGEPMHLGYIDSYVGDVIKILIYTVIAMMVVFFLYFRSKRGMLLPIMAAGISAIWGLGFLSLLQFNLDPLVLVFPFLIAAMAASHSTQVLKRYQEEAGKTGDTIQACKKVITSLFIPGCAGILTDASGIIIIAITPIPILRKITLSCAFWSFITIIVAMIFVPIALSYMPLKPAKLGQGFIDRLLVMLGQWLNRSGKYIVTAFALILFVWGCTYVNKITIGSAVPGSEILWPFHRYNVDSFRITFSMPLLNPLYVILDTGKPQGVARAATTREVVAFSRHMKQTPGKKVVMVETLQGRIPGIHSGMREQDPRWKFLPTDDSQLEFLYRSALQMGGPGSFDKYVDMGDQNTNIIIFCRDKTAQTIKEVISQIKNYLDRKTPALEKAGMRYRLAGGAVGVQAAINETLTEYQLLTLCLSLGVVFVFCIATFQSIIAGCIMIAPLLLSNMLTAAFMVLNNPPLPLTTATLPVSSVGIGLGVDYGIYLASRIIEEYRQGKTLSESVTIAMGTTGKAVIYIATTLIVGIVFWFLSKMMFQALMGLLLAVMLTLNMFGALLVVPSMILIFQPRFITKKR
ncbi:MAG: MMPL family transporter [Desulfobacterota bacterium]|nr:MMPL family transporter [Thermodesulfobacteriota bacterium]